MCPEMLAAQGGQQAQAGKGEDLDFEAACLEAVAADPFPLKTASDQEVVSKLRVTHAFRKGRWHGRCFEEWRRVTRGDGPGALAKDVLDELLDVGKATAEAFCSGWLRARCLFAWRRAKGTPDAKRARPRKSNSHKVAKRTQRTPMRVTAKHGRLAFCFFEWGLLAQNNCAMRMAGFPVDWEP